MLVTALALAGCAYNVTPTTAPAVNIYSSYERKIPGKWAVVLDESVRTIHRDVKPATYICSAHSYPIDVGGALSSSLRRTFEQVADDTFTRDSISSPQAMKAEGVTGSIFVELDEFQPRLSCQQGFWGGTCTSTVDISLGTTIRNSYGQILLSTSAGSTRSADGSAGPGCGDAGNAMAEATSRAMKDSLERLAERMANSTALHPSGAPAATATPPVMPVAATPPAAPVAPIPPTPTTVVAPAPAVTGAPAPSQPTVKPASTSSQGARPAPGAE